MRNLLLSMFAALSLNSCAIAYPTNVEHKPIVPESQADGHVEICDKTETIVRVAQLNKLNPIFISGSSKEYAMIVFINLKTEESMIVRVNKDISCVVGEGATMILKFPQGIQEI